MVAPTCKPGTQEDGRFDANLSYMKLCLEKKRKKIPPSRSGEVGRANGTEILAAVLAAAL